MTPTTNYTDAINALAARAAEDAHAKQAAAAAWKAKNAAEAEELMRPLTVVMESHPDIERLSDISNGGPSPFRRSYRRRTGSGAGAFHGIVAITIDPPGATAREVYVKTDGSSVNYLSVHAAVQGRAPAAEADILIPVALEWCAKLIAPHVP